MVRVTTIPSPFVGVTGSLAAVAAELVHGVGGHLVVADDFCGGCAVLAVVGGSGVHGVPFVGDRFCLASGEWIDSERERRSAGPVPV